MEKRTVSEKIKYYRKLHGMTLEELGEHLGIGKAAMQKIESGNVQNIKSGHIKKLSMLFGTMLYMFLFDDEELSQFEGYQEAQTKVNAFRYMDRVRKLNATGIDRLNQYIMDLSKIEEYQKGYNQK